MKKVSLFSLALLSGLALFAQSNEQLRTPMSVQTRFGIKAGYNSSWLDVNGKDFSSSYPAPNTNARSSWNAGVFANIPLSQIIRFQPELMYSSQGSKMNGTILSTSYNQEVTLHYLNLPLLFQAQTTKGFYVELGPQVGYLLGAKSENENSSSSGKVDIKDYMDKFDFAAVGGIGYLSRIGLGIDARYVYGINNALDVNSGNNGSNFFTSGNMKNRAIQIDLIYQIGASK